MEKSCQQEAPVISMCDKHTRVVMQDRAMILRRNTGGTMSRHVWKFFLISILLTIMLIPAPGMTQAGPGRLAGTVTISGVVFDKTVQINGHTCDLIGAGLFAIG